MSHVAQLVDADGRQPLAGQLVLGAQGAVETEHETLAVLWAAGLADGTRTKYRAAVLELLDTADGQLVGAEVARWRDQLGRAGRSRATIAWKLAAVRSFARALHAQGFIDDRELAAVLDVAPPRINRQLAEPVAPTEAQVEDLDRAAVVLWEHDPLRRSSARTIVAMQAGCGLRLAESAAVRLGDVRARRPTVAARQARGGRDRTAALVLDLRRGVKRGQHRTVPVPSLAQHAIDTHRALLLEHRGGQILDDELPLLAALTGHRPSRLAEPMVAMGERTIQRIVERLAAQAAAPAARHPHALRHAYGLRQARAGLPLAVLMRRMGHLKAETTAGYMRATEHDLLDVSRDPWEGSS